MNPVDDLKLKKSTKLLLWILSIPGAVLIALIIDLVKDSNIYLALKNSKPIDSLLNMVMSVNISSVSILIALLFLSLIYNLFLYKRMSLYFQAAKKFGEWFCGVSTKYAELSGKPVTVKFKEKDLVIDKDFLSKNEQKL